MYRRLRSLAIIIAATSALADCSGGSGPSLAPIVRATATPVVAPSATPASTASGTGTASVTISFPLDATNAKRRDSYFSSKTESIEFQVTAVNGAVPATPIYTVGNTTGAGSACTTSGSTVTCTLSVAAPAGSDTFTASTYFQAGAQGQPISIGRSTVTVMPGVAIDVPLTFLPVVSQVLTSVSPSSSAPIGTATTFTVNVTAKDITGAVIGGTDPYYSPIVINSADTSGHVTATPALPAKLTAPGQALSFAYDGQGTAASYIFTEAVAGDSLSGDVIPVDVALSFTSTAQHLYVALETGTVNVYSIAADGTLGGPVRSLSGAATMLTAPTSLFVDSLGALYVLNQGTNVVVFAAGANGNVAPTNVLSAGQHPSFVGANGDTSFAIVERTTASDPQSSYVVLGSIYRGSYPRGANVSSGSELIFSGINSFAPSTNLGSTGPVVACGGMAPQQGDSSNRASVVCFPGNPIATDSNGVPTNYFYDFQGGPLSVAFRPDGQIVVANQPTYGSGPNVSTYVVPGSSMPQTLNTAATYVLAGSATGLSSPQSVAFDKLGNMYVANYGLSSGAGSIQVFPMNANGNVAPTRSVCCFSYVAGVAVGP